MSWRQALFYDEDLWLLKEMAVGVDEYNEGAPLVTMSGSAAVLVDSLFVESWSCLVYLNFVAAIARHAVLLAISLTSFLLR